MLLHLWDVKPRGRPGKPEAPCRAGGKLLNYGCFGPEMKFSWGNRALIAGEGSDCAVEP